MLESADNIFSSIQEESTPKLQLISEAASQFATSMITKVKQMASTVNLDENTIQKISQNFNKVIDFLKQNKQLILGVSVVTILYVTNQKRTQRRKNSKSMHINSLASNPSKTGKNSVSNRKQQRSCQNLLDREKSTTKLGSKKNANNRFAYLKAFVSQGQQQQQESVRSEVQDKDNPDLSTSTRRTESVVSDIQPTKKKKAKILEPILDLVEEEDQTQDRVFFQMFRKYRDS